MLRQLSPFDKFIIQWDQALKTLSHSLQATRSNPAREVTEPSLSSAEQKHSIGCMRVNHAGEIAAQALYYGQAIYARDAELEKKLWHAAAEEGDHLVWCEERLKELQGRTSMLDPFWYMGALTIGMLAGLAGDKISLGFIAETEKQVTAHLNSHLSSLSPNDLKSRAIVGFMRDDEIRHGENAIENGGVELKAPIPFLMTCAAKVMTTLAYWI